MNLGLNLGLGGARGGASQTVEQQLVAAVTGAGVSAVHNFALATPGATWRSDDLTTNNNDFTQTTAASQPAIGSGGATFDSGDWVGMTIAGQTLTIVMSFTKNDASNTGTMVSDQGAAQILQYDSGSVTGITNVTVDGASVATRGDLYTALHTTGKKSVMLTGQTMTSDTLLRIGRGSGTSLVGLVSRVVVLDESALGAGLTNARTLAQTWVMQ